MYSVVLMTALAAGTATPGHCWHRCGGGGYYGHGCVGCSACWGCYGCGCYGGGCYGGGCYGCGGCGCHGGVYTFGGYGFAGGGFGYHGGCYGAYGTSYGAPYYGACSGCYGCYGGYSGYGIPVPVPEVRVPVDKIPVDPYPPINPKKDDKGAKQPEEVPIPKEKKVDAPKDDKKSSMLESTEPGRAQVRIEIPEGGKLFVDGNAIPTQPGVRVFQTPVLAAGQKYFYDIRIEVERNGQRLGEGRRVVVQSGQQAAIAFPNLGAKGTVTVQANE